MTLKHALLQYSASDCSVWIPHMLLQVHESRLPILIIDEVTLMTWCLIIVTKLVFMFLQMHMTTLNMQSLWYDTRNQKCSQPYLSGGAKWKNLPNFCLFFPIFPLFPIFPDLSWLFPILGNFFPVRGGTLPPWPHSGYATVRNVNCRSHWNETLGRGIDICSYLFLVAEFCS